MGNIGQVAHRKDMQEQLNLVIFKFSYVNSLFLRCLSNNITFIFFRLIMKLMSVVIDGALLGSETICKKGG